MTYMEEIERELNDLRRENDDLRRENDSLWRALVNEDENGDKLSDAGALYKKAASERTQYKRDRTYLLGAINTAIVTAKILHEAADKVFSEPFAKLPKSAPYGFRRVANMVNHAEKDMVSEHNERVELDTDPAGRLSDPSVDLLHAVSLARIAGVKSFAAQIALWIRSDNDPLMRCLFAKMDLASQGHVEPDTLETIPLEWISKHIGNGRSISHKLLYEACEHAWRYRQKYYKKQGKAGYEADHHVGQETLKGYVRYLDRILELAEASPEDARQLMRESKDLLGS